MNGTHQQPIRSDIAPIMLPVLVFKACSRQDLTSTCLSPSYDSHLSVPRPGIPGVVHTWIETLVAYRGPHLADAGALLLALQPPSPADCPALAPLSGSDLDPDESPALAPLSAATRIMSWRGMAQALAGCDQGRGLLEV